MSPLEAQALVISLILTVVLGVVLWGYQSVSVETGGRGRAGRTRPAGSLEPQGDNRPRDDKARTRFRAVDAYRSLAVVPIVALFLGVLWWS